MKRNPSPCDLARVLFERGANVIPIVPAGKEPIGRWAHWATHPQTWPDVERLQLVGHDPSRRAWWACHDVLDGVAHVLQANALEVGPALALLRTLPVAKTVAGWGGC